MAIFNSYVKLPEGKWRIVHCWSFQDLSLLQIKAQGGDGNDQCHVEEVAMDQYLLIPFLVGWTSIYQLFWGSPGVQGFDTLPSGKSWGDFQWRFKLKVSQHCLDATLAALAHLAGWAATSHLWGRLSAEDPGGRWLLGISLGCVYSHPPFSP